MSKPTLLITGSEGFTGRHAMDFFHNHYKVIGVSRKKLTNRCTADLTNEEEVNHLIKAIKPELILHLAGQNHVQKSWKDPVYTIKSNFMSTLYLLSSVKKHTPDTKMLVVGSALQSVGVYPHPYSFSKSLQGELTKVWCDLYDGNAMFVKTTNLIGPGPSTGVCANIAKQLVDMEQHHASPTLDLNNEQAERDYLDVRDAIKAYKMILEKGKPRVVYSIGSGKFRTTLEIVQVYQNLSDISFSVTFAECIPDKPSAQSAIDVSLLGWKQEIPFQKSLRDTLEYFRTFNNKGERNT